MLAKMTIRQLEAEIARRQENLPQLQKKRSDLVNKLADIDKQIADLAGGDVKKTPKKKTPKKKTAKKKARIKNKESLVDVLVKILKGKEGLTVQKATEAVISSGYKSTSKTFKLLVNQTLSRNPKFKKVDRGTYALKEKQTIA